MTSSHLLLQVKDVPQSLAHSIRDRNLLLFRHSSDILRLVQGDEFSFDTPPSNLMYKYHLPIQ